MSKYRSGAGTRSRRVHGFNLDGLLIREPWVEEIADGNATRETRCGGFHRGRERGTGCKSEGQSRTEDCSTMQDGGHTYRPRSRAAFVLLIHTV
jgi:hypothetical protein